MGQSSTIRVIASGDDGRVEMGVVTLELRWDAAASDWVSPRDSEEIAAEVWKAMALLARDAGWLVPAAA